MSLLALAMVSVVPSLAQDDGAARLTDDVSYRAEAQVSISNGTTPLWLNANKYGLSSMEEANGYLRAAVERPLQADSAEEVDSLKKL